MKMAKLLKQSKLVRDLFYGDGHECKNIRSFQFSTYLSDNADNIKVLENAIKEEGIRLVVAPTGAGKSVALLESAKRIVAQDKDCKVIIALPTRALTLQVGGQGNVYTMLGGEELDEKKSIIATTYEKIFEVENFIYKCRKQKKDTKIYLILDECHLLTTQHLFRKAAIKNLISCIERNLFHSVTLVTATPQPMTLFHYKEVLNFESKKNNLAFEKVELVLVDDVVEYIKKMDFGKVFPFIRLNNMALIEEIQKDIPEIGRVTSHDKKSQLYLDIINNSRVSDKEVCGVLASSAIEAGVSIKNYPSNILPIAAFPDNNIGIDDMEQFLSRIRKNGNQIEKVQIIMRKPKEREIKASLVNEKGERLCEFKKVDLKMGDIFINDVEKLDSIKDGSYKVKIEIGSKSTYKNLIVASMGGTEVGGRYSKEDSMPLMFQNVGFESFISILKSNYGRLQNIIKSFQTHIDMAEENREKRKTNEHLSDTYIELLAKEDEKLLSGMISGAIRNLGEMKECISFVGGKLEVDNRILYMVSYKQFERQYYYNHDFLKRELENRLNVKVILREAENEKAKHKKTNPLSLWEGLEDLRQSVQCNDDYWNCIMGNGGLYMKSKERREEIYQFRGQAHLMELLQDMGKAGIMGGLALDILVLSDKKAIITKLMNYHHIIVYNKVLNNYKEKDLNEIPLLNKSQKEKMQLVIFCYLKDKGQSTYKVNDKLLDGIITLYKDTYPLSSKIPTKRKIKGMLKQMYKIKEDGKKGLVIRGELKTEVREILKKEDSLP